MGKLILKNFWLSAENNEPQDWEFFNEYASFYIGKEGSDAIDLFNLNIISTKWINENVKNETHCTYLKYCLIMKYYDEKLIKQHIEKIIKACNYNDDKKNFNCLTHHFEYQEETELY